MEIITGERKRLFSRVFGRTAYNPPDWQQYDKFGTYGNIAMASGYWIRQFPITDEKYKSLQISLKDYFDTIKTVFNVGVGIEYDKGKQRLRIEDLKYFYQSKVAIKLPRQIVNVKRTIDDSLYFSSAEFGYSKGGDYENQIGLDEPNTKTEWVTPIRKSRNKFQKICPTRADEYGLELCRRVRYELEPNEDSSYDEHNWLFDVMFLPTSATGLQQMKWYGQPSLGLERLDAVPQGLLFPEMYHTFFFTPMTMLKRHGWVLRAGMNEDINRAKKLIYANSKANTNLILDYTDDIPRKENDDFLVDDLELPRFTTEIVEFEHPVDDALMDLILGTTKGVCEGSIENIPNFYHKFEWENENGETETGYLLNLKPKGAGKWRMLKATNIYSKQDSVQSKPENTDFEKRVAYEGGILECKK